jgi:molecular chaperone HtpG
MSESTPAAENGTSNVETFEFRAEMKQLLHLIIHSLYTHEEIFLRELISNSSDALNKIRFRMLTDRNVVDPDAEQRIDITLDKDANTLSLTDTGVGMSREDLMTRIGTVASSGTLDFVKEMKKGDGPVDAQMIGQFGVGFYSAFMVADTITIDTRHADPDGVGLRWKSDGSGSYTIEETDRAERGTTITLALKEDKTDFTQKWRIDQIIKKYSNFVDFPIYVDGEKVNTVEAVWHKSKSDVTDEQLNEFYKFVSNDYEEPLGHLQVNVEGRVSFKSLLFIPKKAPKTLYQDDFQFGVHLYSSKVFIQDDAKNLLPDWARFIKGVVDTEDLPLNVSREVTQNSPVFAKIRQILTGKLLSMLKEWSVEESDRFKTFSKEFGMLFKSGLSSDFENRDEMIELIRFESSAKEAGELVSLEQYVDRMKEGQKDIYYVLAESRKAAEMNPNLEYFAANDLEVLLMVEPVDAFIVPGIPKYKDHDLKSVETADLDIKKKAKKDKNAPSKADTKKIIDRFKTILGDKVEDVKASERLVDSAATLVVGKSGMDSQMERMMKMMDENFEGAKKVLEINVEHPLIKNLIALHTEKDNDSLVESAILQVFEGAQLADGSLLSPREFVRRMTELMVQATKN